MGGILQVLKILQFQELRSRITGSHRMAEVGRVLWRSSGPTPFSSRAAQGHVQMAFQYLWGWRLHDSSGQPVPVLSHPHSEKAFPYAEKETPVFQFVPIASGPVTGHCWKNLDSIFSILSLQVFVHIDKIAPEPFFIQAEQLFQSFLTGDVLQSLNILMALDFIFFWRSHA